jgi:hypothetical protein
MIRIELTRRQTRQLSKHLKMVNIAFKIGQRGTFVAQVQQDWWDPDGPAYVRAHFYPRELADPIVKAVAKARIPQCYVGIPQSAFESRPPSSTSCEQQP